jgi:pimeloyl-ACP methyl ester carboxylesterase
MKTLPPWFRAVVRVVSGIPLLGTAFVWALFWRLGPAVSVRSVEAPFHARARVVDLNGVVGYVWGAGERTVLLVHGWQSRASRFATIGEELVARGYTVVAFDAPGNGDSPGTRTHAYDYVEAIRELARRHGEFEAVIAHSFGAVATFIAARGEVRTKRIVTIAGVHDFASIVRDFGRAVGLGRGGVRRLRESIERWAAARGIDPWREVVAELDPADTHTPLLVVHDSGDREVALEQAMQIVEAHTGVVETLITDGLGHNRVPSAPEVVERVVRFVTTPIGRELPTR